MSLPFLYDCLPGENPPKKFPGQKVTVLLRVGIAEDFRHCFIGWRGGKSIHACMLFGMLLERDYWIFLNSVQ